MHDDLGNIHNVIDLTDYKPYEYDDPAEPESEGWTTQYPDFSEYSTEPPTMPVVLAKSAFVAVEPPLAKMPPNIPLHSISNHFYHDYCRSTQNRTREKLLNPNESKLDPITGAVPDEDRMLIT